MSYVEQGYWLPGYAEGEVPNPISGSAHGGSTAAGSIGFVQRVPLSGSAHGGSAATGRIGFADRAPVTPSVPVGGVRFGPRPLRSRPTRREPLPAFASGRAEGVGIASGEIIGVGLMAGGAAGVARVSAGITGALRATGSTRGRASGSARLKATDINALRTFWLLVA